MHSPRAQADKKAYQAEIKRLIEEAPNLTLRQEVVEDLLRAPGAVSREAESTEWETAIENSRSLLATPFNYRRASPWRRYLSCRAVVLTTGTFLQALMHTGETKTPGGRAGEGTTGGISAALSRLGFRMARSRPARRRG